MMENTTDTSITFDELRRKLGYRIVNMGWAQLEDNYRYTPETIARVADNKSIQFYNNANFDSSDPIPVKEGDIWRVITRSSDFVNWSPTDRGLFLDNSDRFIAYISPENDCSSDGVCTFKIPKGASKMIVNTYKSDTPHGRTHILKLCDWNNIWHKEKYGYFKNKYVDENGVISNTSENIAMTGEIPVSPGEIYRIANTHATSLEFRGVFFNDIGNLVSQIPVPNNNIPYNWNDIIVPDGASKMIVNYNYEIQTRKDTSDSLSINRAVPAQIEYSNSFSKLKGKVLAAYGDSTTWYGGWLRLVENVTGLSVYNNGYGSASMSTYRGDNILCDDDRIDKLMSCDPDIVTILSGLNSGDTLIGDEGDFFVEVGQEDKSTFLGAYSYVVKRILTIKPHVKIIVMTTSYNDYEYKNDGGNEITGLSSLDFARASKKVAEYFGLQIADLRHTTQMNKYTSDLMLSDNVHFSMRGEEAIAGTLLRELKNINWFSK